MPSRRGPSRRCSLLRRLLRRRFALPQLAPRDDVRVVDVPGRSKQPRPLLDRERAQQAAVADDRLECLGRRFSCSASSCTEAAPSG